jgi:hypothetical protein
MQESSIVGRIVWLGVVANSESNLRAVPVEEFDLSFAGKKHISISFLLDKEYPQDKMEIVTLV